MTANISGGSWSKFATSIIIIFGLLSTANQPFW